MREIKFRAWLIGSQAMLQDVGFDNSSGQEHGVLELLQYIGIKDKNGKEIYEGDYVVSDHISLGEPLQGVVEYNHTGAYVLARGSFKTLIHELKYNKWQLEVLGNIYENPELLK